MVVVKRALLSCSEKTGLDGLAGALAELGVELVASSGTAEFLKQHRLAVRTVEEFAGITEQLDGRVKTLHPKIHAGILARRDDPAHIRAVGEAGFIDLVVVTLYPFQQTVERRGVSLPEAVEHIDVGGVALLRAAAKNFAHVAVVCQPQQYPTVIEALRRGKGQLPEDLARRLATAAFHLTSAYDTAISSYLAADDGPRGFPEAAGVSVRQRQLLRYGENPHQRAAWYVSASGVVWGLGTLTQLQGKALSYNNLLDLDVALRCLLDFDEPTCTVIKHHAPCGLASAAAPLEAYRRVLACDPESAFGGVVGCNRPIDAALAEQLTSTFLEVILAPSVEPQAAAVFGNKPNLRVVTVDWPSRIPPSPEWRHLLGSWLLQDPDTLTVQADSLQVVTQRLPGEQERVDLLFAWRAVKHVKSNGIVLVGDRATVGIGQGQPSRVGSVRLAIQQAGGRSRQAVAASDGFFPFPDSVELLAKAGVTAIIQPGGSVRDAEVVAAADAAKIAMLMTGVRHFRH